MNGLPTLDEFLAWGGFPNNSYLDEVDFASLYVRKGDIYITLNGTSYLCSRVLTIASVEAENPGKGAFTKLVKRLMKRDLAIFVENVHNSRFRSKLLRLGFRKVDGNLGLNFLCNHAAHIKENQR